MRPAFPAQAGGVHEADGEKRLWSSRQVGARRVGVAEAQKARRFGISEAQEASYYADGEAQAIKCRARPAYPGACIVV